MIICTMKSPHWQNMPLTHSPHQRRKISRLIPTSRHAVTSDNNCFRDKLHLSSLCLNHKRISVAHSEQQVEWQPPIEFVNDDRFVTGVPIPPVASLFPIRSFMILQCPLGLSRSSRSLQYMYFYFMVTWFRLHTQVLFKSTIVTHPKIKFIICNIFNTRKIPCRQRFSNIGKPQFGRGFRLRLLLSLQNTFQGGWIIFVK